MTRRVTDCRKTGSFLRMRVLAQVSDKESGKRGWCTVWMEKDAKVVAGSY